MKWLRDARQRKNLTTYEVAEMAGIAQSYYAMIEQGSRVPSIAVARQIGQTLDADWRRFFG